jgi:hypothetical protein
VLMKPAMSGEPPPVNAPDGAEGDDVENNGMKAVVVVVVGDSPGFNTVITVSGAEVMVLSPAGDRLEGKGQGGWSGRRREAGHISPIEIYY